VLRYERQALWSGRITTSVDHRAEGGSLVIDGTRGDDNHDHLPLEQPNS